MTRVLVFAADEGNGVVQNHSWFCALLDLRDDGNARWQQE